MNSPQTHDQTPADGGNAQRKRPAEGPADDNTAGNDNQVISNIATISSADNVSTTTSHLHSTTTPESSVTSSRHEHQSHNGIVSGPRKVGSLQKNASFDAQQLTLQGLRKTQSDSADREDRLKATDDRPRTGVQENPKGIDQTTTECGVNEHLTNSPPTTSPTQAEVDPVIILPQEKIAGEERTTNDERIALIRGDTNYDALIRGNAEPNPIAAIHAAIHTTKYDERFLSPPSSPNYSPSITSSEGSNIPGTTAHTGYFITPISPSYSPSITSSEASGEAIPLDVPPTTSSWQAPILTTSEEFAEAYQRAQANYA